MYVRALGSVVLVLFFCLAAEAEEKVCTYQDAALKEGVCGYLPESVQTYGFAEKGTSKHYHFRVEDLSLIRDENPMFHLRVSPCSGGISVWVKTNPFPWPTEYDFRYEANNTEPGSIKTVDTPLYNRDYYISVDAIKDTNFSIVAYTNRNFLALPPVAGDFGVVEAAQEKLTVPAVKVKFTATKSDPNAMYQVYKAKIVEVPEIEAGDSPPATSDELPVCLDYSASMPCKIMYSACGIEAFGVPVDDGGFEPRENDTKIMRYFQGEPGEKYFVNVVVVGENGIKSAYRGAQVSISNAPDNAAVDSSTQITIIAIVSGVGGVLALLMAYAALKMRKAVNMKDPTKKKKKKRSKNKATSQKQIGNMLRGVVPSPKKIEAKPKKQLGMGTSPPPRPPPPGPPPKKRLGVGTAPPPRPSPPGPPPKKQLAGGNGPPPRPPPPGPPPRGAILRNAKSVYVVNTPAIDEKRSSIAPSNTLSDSGSQKAAYMQPTISSSQHIDTSSLGPKNVSNETHGLTEEVGKKIEGTKKRPTPPPHPPQKIKARKNYC